MSQSESFSDHKAKYAAWRERMKAGVQSNKLIDLTQEPETEADEADDWSTESLFVGSDDADEDLLDELPA